MATATATQNKEMELARRIATAVFTKLKLTETYVITVRRFADPAPMPWIEIAFCKVGKDPVIHEHCISMPESQFKGETLEDRTRIATYVIKCVSMMLGKKGNK